jgi:glucose-6-phosphate isomerase
MKINFFNIKIDPKLKLFSETATILEKKLFSDKNEWSFLELLDQYPKEDIAQILNLTSAYSSALLFGIGGSDLGARAIYSCLSSQYQPKKPLYFAGDSLLVKELIKDLSCFHPKKTLPIVVSKSGTTLETLIAFNFLWQTHKPQQAVIITEKESPLWQFARKNNFFCLEFPKEIEGRYSVLSVSALFAIAFAGYNVQKILQGAQATLSKLKESLKNKNSLAFKPAFSLALSHFLAFNEKRNISVLALYGKSLESLGNWWRQLWAESLGKNNQGQTPVLAIMPRDQHSQLQLYLDGPDDKIYTFLKINQSQEAKLQTPLPLLANLKKKNLNQILEALFTGTSKALINRKRPLLILEAEKLDEEFLGEFFLTYEIACALLGSLLKINPFSQDAVEEGKKITRKLLF